jgi:hypothetical protein
VPFLLPNIVFLGVKIIVMLLEKAPTAEYYIPTKAKHSAKKAADIYALCEC